METGGNSGLPETPKMLPPPPGSFVDREELIEHVSEFGIAQGYVVTIRNSRKDVEVIMCCDRGRVHRDRQNPEDEASVEHSRKRKTVSKRINCPFECVGKKWDGLWVLSVRNGAHNHEPLKDVTEHPYARRFTESEELQVKDMSGAGMKPRQIIKKLKQSNPDLLATPKQVYNLLAKFRQGNVPGQVRKLRVLRPDASSVGKWCKPTTSGPSRRHCNQTRVPILIRGRFVDSQSSTFIDVINPATQKVVSQVPLTTQEEFRAAVFAAKRAFPLWRNTPVADRRRIMFRFQELIRREIDKLALNITTEHGKPLKDAHNEVLHGLEVVEHACQTASLQMGDFTSNLSIGLDSYSNRDPLGVCAGICSSNFPAMVPLSMFHVAVTCGNTFILKPSEKVPGASITLAELALEAGLPNGVLNIVHGTDEIINSLCDDDDIQVVSFAGSDSATRYKYARGTSCKSVQSNMGTKNHAIVMPDASVDVTLNALVSAAFAAAGQRVMVTNAVIFVGGLELWENKLVERAKLLKVNAGTESDADLGPVISQQAKEQTYRLIQSGIDCGARLALDGRSIMVQSYELGNFIGPTILFNIKDHMKCYKEEILGPVLLCLKADSLEEAINIVNRNKLGKGASIYTNSDSATRKFQTEIEADLIGINVPVAAPLPIFSLTSKGASFSGDLNFHGEDGVQHYTRVKRVAQRWRDFPSSCGISGSNGEFMANPEISENGEETLENIESFANRESSPLLVYDESQEIEDA